MKAFFAAAITASLLLGATTADAAAFDARDPAEVLTVIAANGASGDLKKDDKGMPYIDAKAGTLSFEVDFFDCDQAGGACATAIYATGWDLTSVSLDQINRWNRWTLMCPAYLTTDNHPHAWFAVKPSANDTRADVANQLNTWLDCLSDFDKFTDAPDAFLKAHE
jgi:hypothetical protein